MQNKLRLELMTLKVGVGLRSAFIPDTNDSAVPKWAVGTNLKISAIYLRAYHEPREWLPDADAAALCRGVLFTYRVLRR